MSCGEDNDQEGSGTSSLNFPDHGLKTSCVKGGTHPIISSTLPEVEHRQLSRGIGHDSTQIIVYGAYTMTYTDNRL
jgi:hypothetical protein